MSSTRESGAYANFWNSYDGTKSPVDGSRVNVNGSGGTEANGDWKKKAS